MSDKLIQISLHKRQQLQTSPNNMLAIQVYRHKAHSDYNALKRRDIEQQHLPSVSWKNKTQSELNSEYFLKQIEKKQLIIVQLKQRKKSLKQQKESYDSQKHKLLQGKRMINRQLSELKLNCIKLNEQLEKMQNKSEKKYLQEMINSLIEEIELKNYEKMQIQCSIKDLQREIKNLERVMENLSDQRISCELELTKFTKG